ncbi:MAG: choice-of-anchor Q domain-containing protein, partial [Rhodanobacteraceae bacterium]
TIQSDPGLFPLANFGGPTLTHALRPDSPAINAGNNAFGLDNDQRGATFPRVVGPAADIGAVEFDADVIFADGFD